MGLSAVAGAGAGASAATSLTSPVALGAGGVFVAAALVALLAYLDLLDASSLEAPAVRPSLLAAVIPLGLTFAGVVLFESLQVLGHL